MAIKAECEKDPRSSIWRSKLNYLYTRNITDRDFALLEYLNKMIGRYPKTFKSVLMEYIYERRSR